jgi:hypothetical protein
MEAADLCILEQWRLGTGASSASRAIKRLETIAATHDSSGTRAQASTCAALLAAMSEAQGAAPSETARNRLDYQLTHVLPEWTSTDPLLYAGNLVAARLHAAANDTERALAAVRRHGYGAEAGARSVMFLTSFLFEEARLAARAGDRAGAVRAINGYLRFRASAEPHLRRRADGVRAGLGRP